VSPDVSLAFVSVAVVVSYAGRRPVAELVMSVGDVFSDCRTRVRRGRPDDAIPRRGGVADDEQRHLELLVVAGAVTPAELLDQWGAPREAACPTHFDHATRRAA
jgi:hypothetical protein